MSFSFNKYAELLNARKIDDAIRYRAANIPDTLFKFISLSDDKALNIKKFDTLEADSLWVAPPVAQNDPYEFAGMFFDIPKLLDAGFDSDVLNKTMDMLKSQFCIASFTAEMANNLPMWAHYANNHKGLCIEYSVQRKEIIRNVSYEPERIPIASIFGNFLHYAQKADDDPSFIPEVEYYSTILQEMYFLKHKSWESEHEFRILYPWEDLTNTHGFAISNKELGLEINSIYSGFSCSKEHQERLCEIANSLGVNYSQCRLSDSKYTVFD